ncbi:hypothetical protein PF005_g31656 [Phytophthora fragariae]|uniref:Uncharacterized protein n=2 Tax=Phytophthora TaxID=4783 RepID=A0A6A3GRS4_9STRA|nr:hypothetical protein PF003_g29253 [Phytophthora fragariae]KAE8958583.1 hypothetical protein PR002_g30822 [Phytophthora rubi]KAE8917963.1 hypothetical protein PF009_g31720 [Phytophthora fragariae]KAE8957918.1 hypothetical protein PF011_g30969 [Phytophthora fragariae]KAE8958748.1 hypothetical protein PR001_g30955 [Phytophthora rubi]
MTDPTSVTLELLQSMSDENRTEELQAAIAACNFMKLRLLCQELGVRIRSNKYQAYQTKDGYAEILFTELKAKTMHGDASPPSHTPAKNPRVPVLTGPVPEAMATSEEGDASAPAAHAATSDELGCMLNPYVGPVSKDILERTLLMVSIEKAGRALKELFHPDSEAAKIIRAELTSRLERLKRLQQE